MNATQTAPATTAVLLAEYNAITEYQTPRAAELAIQILEGDLSGPLPKKGEKVTSDCLPDWLIIRPILAPKPGKLTPLQAAAEFVSTDTLRPAMCGVYHHTSSHYGETFGAAVGTNGHTLGVFPAEAPEANVILNPRTFAPLKEGDKIGRYPLNDEPGRYPDYQNVIPTAGRTNPAYIITDIQALRNQLAGISRASRFTDSPVGILASIYHEGEYYMVNPDFAGLALRTLQATGATRIQLELGTPRRAIVFRDMDCPEKMVLVMPVLGCAFDGTANTFCELLNTAIPQAAPAAPAPKAPRKRTVEPTSPASIADLAAANVAHETLVLAEVASLGDMTYSDAQALVDFGSFDYMQCLSKGLTPTETAGVLLQATSPHVVEVTVIQRPHQIGQPITHAPTIAALAECVALVAAQVQEQPLTSPAPTEGALNEARESQAQLRELAATGNEFHKHFLAESIKQFGDLSEQPLTSPAVADAFTRMQAAHIVFEQSYQTDARPAAIVELDAAEAMLIAAIPGAAVWAKDEEEGACLTTATEGYEAGDIRTPMYGVTIWGEWCPAAMSKQDAVAYFAASTASAERLCALDDAPAPTSPASPEPAMPAKRKNLFSKLTNAGARVKVLHQVGKCGVAHVTPAGPERAPHYVARWRSHYATFGHLSEAIAALWQLRRMENANVRRDAERLTFADFLAALPEYKPPTIYEFYERHSLDPNQSYPRAELRRTVTTAKLDKYPKYLSWINRVSPTSPATT